MYWPLYFDTCPSLSHMTKDFFLKSERGGNNSQCILRGQHYCDTKENWRSVFLININGRILNKRLVLKGSCMMTKWGLSLGCKDDSIDVIDYINRMEDERCHDHLNRSMQKKYARKFLTFYDETVKNLRREGIYLNIIKAIAMVWIPSKLYFKNRMRKLMVLGDESWVWSPYKWHQTL